MSVHMNESGNIELQKTVREIEERLHRVEEKLFAPADGSGTGRYSDGSGTGRYVDNWTQESDGTQYAPSSYGTGKEPLPPFVPFEAPDVVTVGSSFRIMRADQSVDPEARVATAVSAGLVTYESDGETLEVSRDHVVTVKA